MKIPTSKSGCMSQLLMLVSTGYKHWIRGEMHYGKAAGFAAKMASMYPINATSDQRSWYKKTGKYAAFLIMYPHDKDPSKIMYWLLATNGAAPKGFLDIHEREKLSNAEAAALGWRDQYELRHIPHKGKKSTWTWCMRSDYYARLSASSKESADAGSDALKSFFGKLRHMPMFNGIRSQIVGLDNIAKITWKKQRKTAYPNPLKPVDSDLKEGEIAASFLPVMPKITVWGDLNLDILILKIKEQEYARQVNGSAQADAILSIPTCDHFITVSPPVGSEN